MRRIPKVGQPISDGRGEVTQPWRVFLQSLEKDSDSSAEIESIARKLGSPDGTVDGIPEDRGTELDVVGIRSVHVTKLGKLIRVGLRGDDAPPGNNAFYGVGSDGEPGFHLVTDALAANEGVSKTVDGKGVSTFALQDVVPADGGTLQRTQFDDKGRRTHEAPATTTHLPEGDNLYFTDERVDARLGAIGVLGGIYMPLTNGAVPPELVCNPDGSLIYTRVA